MVLRLKTRESRSLPGLLNATQNIFSNHKTNRKNTFQPTTLPVNAGWSSPVARQAHNLKAAGSNPAPATKYTTIIKTPWLKAAGFWRFWCFALPRVRGGGGRRRRTSHYFIFRVSFGAGPRTQHKFERMRHYRAPSAGLYLACSLSPRRVRSGKCHSQWRVQRSSAAS